MNGWDVWMFGIYTGEMDKWMDGRTKYGWYGQNCLLLDQWMCCFVDMWMSG
jgi:hypothetical protein